MSKNKTEVVITVTESHIKRGNIAESKSCPIALAFHSKKYTNVDVDGDTVVFTNRSGREIDFALPNKAKKFIDRFDSGKKVKPFSFTLKYN